MNRPWVLRMRWLNHHLAPWPVDVDALAANLPAGLELDLFDGQAWLGIVPFTMADVAPRGIPAIPRFSVFPELNVRTYVRHNGKPGVFFLSLDAASRATVEGARRVFHLPYYRAAMASEDDHGTIAYRSQRVDRRGQPAAFEARFRPVGTVEPAADGSLESFLTDRMRLFAVDRRGRISQSDIAHRPWPLQPAEATISVNTMASAHGIELPDRPAHLLFARRVDVRAWAPRTR
jgi:uncharacterized protein YqjF (DUF2071 family)